MADQQVCRWWHIKLVWLNPVKTEVAHIKGTRVSLILLVRSVGIRAYRDTELMVSALATAITVSE